MTVTTHPVRTARFASLCATWLLVGCSAVAEGPEYPDRETFIAAAGEGDVWSCADGTGFVTIVQLGHIDQTSEGAIYSGSVAPTLGGLPVVEHAPFAADAFARCLEEDPTNPAIRRAFADVDFEEGYGIWREAFDQDEAGYFTNGVSETYLAIVGIVTQSEGEAQ